MRIRELGLDRREDIVRLLREGLDSINESHRPPPRFVDVMMGYWSDGTVKILGMCDNDDTILGIVTLGRLFLTQVAKSDAKLDEAATRKIEKKLFDAGFKRLKDYQPWVTTGPDWLTDNLLEHALSVGFRKYEVVHMQASREELEAVQVPPVPPGYTLSHYDDRRRDEIAKLFYQSFRGTIDARSVPDNIATEDRCHNLLGEMMKGRYGDFRDGRLSWTLDNGGQLVGASLFIIQGNAKASCGALFMKLSHRGKGLGRLVFMHGARYLLETAPEVDGIELTTGITNSARRLYESVGFKEFGKLSVYTWVKRDF